MSKQSIKQTIDDNVYQNGQQRITGIVLNSVLNGMVDNEYSELDKKPNIAESGNDADLDVSDEEGNVIARFENGGLRTKNFNSATTPAIADSSKADFDIIDDNGYVIVRFREGHIITKNFDSRNGQGGYIPILRGKKVAFIGDSITAGHSASPRDTKRYSKVFCDMMECTEVNLGVAGTCIADNTKNGLGSSRFVTRATASNLEDVDLVVVFGGTNDLSYDRKAIGDYILEETITASGNMGTKHYVIPTDKETFSGAMHELITTIQSICPLTPIVFMTPLKRNHNSASNPDYLTCNSNGDFMIDFVNTIKNICAFYSIPVIDLYSDSQLNPLSPAWSSLFADGLHPNNRGHEIIANILYKWVNSNLVL